MRVALPMPRIPPETPMFWLNLIHFYIAALAFITVGSVVYLALLLWREP